MSPLPLIEQLAQRQLLVVTGKGGVGKTAVSATLGRILARAGRRTLVLEVDPRENLHQMLGMPPSGGDILQAEPRLWVQNLKPRQVLDEVVRDQLKLELLVRRVLDSPVYENFANGAPGLKELAILGHSLRLLRGVAAMGPPGTPPPDVIVLDAPATGHGVTLLASPRLVTDVIQNGPFAYMARELTQLIADPRRCGIVVVTQAEEMPVQEALELRAALRERIGRDAEALIVNGLYPAIAATDRENPLVSLWRHRRSLNERELNRLTEGWEGPRIELPLLPIDRGPTLIAALERCLLQSVEEGAWS